MRESDPSVRLVLYQDGCRIDVGSDSADVEVAEGEVLFCIEGCQRGPVFLDDRPLRVAFGKGDGSCWGRFDLTNEVGYHRITCNGGKGTIAFDFRTTTTKATRDEVQTMARLVAGQLFDFRHQFLYADSENRLRVVRVPEVEFAWCRERVTELGHLATAVAVRPARENARQYVVSTEARNVSLAHTSRLLRQSPSLLELADDGPVEIGSSRYWPSAVVVKQSHRRPVRTEHQQLAFLLSMVAAVVEDLMPHAERASVVETVLNWRHVLRAARALPVIRLFDTPGLFAPASQLPSVLQRTDARYGRLRELHAEFSRDIQPVDAPADAAIRVNIRDVWEIYQAFAAHLVGRAFALRYVSNRGDLRERAPRGYSMASEDFELYYNVRPPSSVLSSWRDPSVRPGHERPDVILVERRTQRVAVLDVKFKTDGDRAVARDLLEMQAYMNSYGIRSAGVIFPSSAVDPTYVRGGGFQIAEIALRAATISDMTVALSSLRRTVEGLLCAPQTR
jgi:hypothetical protein